VRTYIIELLSKVLYINNELHDITEILLKVALNTLTRIAVTTERGNSIVVSFKEQA
jgi:hypothetical protein